MKSFISFGGDGRTQYTSDYVTEKGYKTIMTNSISDITSCDAIILPLPFTIDNIYIKGTSTKIEDLIKYLDKQTVLFAGKLNDNAINILKNNDITFYDYNSRDEFAQKNAVPTAQGVLTFVLNNTDVTLNQLKIAVLGYGKCGKSICRTFKSMGSEVISYSRRYSSAADAESDGLTAYLLKDICETISYADIIINTVPFNILGKEIIDRISNKAMLIDVSSYPYGFDYNYAKSVNKNINLLSSLPGKYVPKTAGIIIGETIINIIEEGGLWKESN